MRETPSIGIGAPPMTISRETATRIATAINSLRPDWRIDSMVSLIGQRHQHRLASDLAAALAWVALDPASKNPGRIDAHGPWWPARTEADRSPQPPVMRRGELEPTNTPTPERRAQLLAEVRDRYRKATQ